MHNNTLYCGGIMTNKILSTFTRDILLFYTFLFMFAPSQN